MSYFDLSIEYIKQLNNIYSVMFIILRIIWFILSWLFIVYMIDQVNTYLIYFTLVPALVIIIDVLYFVIYKKHLGKRW